MIKTYKVLLPIGYSGRQEKGTILDLEENVAKAYGDEYLVEVSAITESEEDSQNSTDEKSVEEMSLAELKEKAASMQLPITGSKADLIERINLALA